VAGLTREEVLRYSRHLLLPEVGVGGQERLKDGRVLCVGAGGLGSPLALYLAAAGVGTLGVVDSDVVDASNLQRQILHGTKDIGRPKTRSAQETLADVNPNVRVVLHDVRLDASNALDILGAYDVVADGTDNFPTRYLVNDACVLLGKPNAYGSIFRFEGQASVFCANGAPCYRCLYPEPPPPSLVPSCAEGGVLGVLPGVIGTIQATEVIKLLLGAGETLAGRLLLYDALTMRFRELRVRKDPECPVCGANPTIRALGDVAEGCGVPAVQGVEDAAFEIEPRELKRRLDAGEPVCVLDVRNPDELAICRLEGARWIPLMQLPERVGELDASVPTVVLCHTGFRSAEAVRFLRGIGFAGARNLSGGIDAWALDVDPSIGRY
jgi:adenylyltransferase/sulfurtransferase